MNNRSINFRTTKSLAIIGLVLTVLAACVPTRAPKDARRNNGRKSPESVPVSQSPVPRGRQEKPRRSGNWRTHFTFGGRTHLGPYTVDPDIWVYTREFAERFGMPEKWISSRLMGAEAVAWHQAKTGYVTCGWAGKKDACSEEEEPVLEIYFDAKKTNLPWAPWARESDVLELHSWVSSQHFLVPQHCELRRKNSTSPIGDRGERCAGRIARQPMSDPSNGNEIFFFAKGVTYRGQGNFFPISAYDKKVYPGLAWVEMYFAPQGVNFGRAGENVQFTLETRDAPLGKTVKVFHEILLPGDYVNKLTDCATTRRKRKRKFLRKAFESK